MSDVMYKALADAKIATSEEGHGKIMGYAMVFDVVDLQGDVTRKGAFTKTIQERVAAGKVPLMVRHMAFGGDTPEIIGTLTLGEERTEGLWIEADLNGSQLAQETRAKVAGSPNVFGMSIGFETITSKTLGAGRELLELKLREVTVTAQPAVEQTTAAAKSADLAAQVQALQERVDAISPPADTEPPAAKSEAPPAISHELQVRLSRIHRRTTILELES